MSKKHSMPEMKEGGVNVTPLIDVVMCLIIFFMLVAKIGVSTGAKPMALPTTLIGKKLDQIPDTVILNVTDPDIQHDSGGHVIREDPNNPESPPKREEGKPPSEQPDVWASFDATTTGAGTAEQVAVRYDPPGGGVPSFPLREKLKIMLTARKAQGPEKEKNFSVTLRAEEDLPFSKLEKVLAAIAEAGIANVNYAASEPRGQAAETQK